MGQTDLAVRLLAEHHLARHEPDIPERMLAYHGLLRHRHRPLPVLSMVVYLIAEPPAEPLPRSIDDDQLKFRYEVFCPWEHAIGLEAVRRRPALAPLAALTPGIAEEDLPALQEAIEASPALSASRRGDLLALTYFIAGRRFASNLLRSLVGSKLMEESSTYRYVMEKGREEGRQEGRREGQREGLRRAILDLVEARLAQSPEKLEARLSALDEDALHQLFSELLRARDETELSGLLPR